MNDAAARRLGDVVRSSLAPLAGALVGGLVALSLQRETVVRALADFARAAWTEKVDLAAALHVVAARALPIVLAAFSGALVVGSLQTRGSLRGLGAVGFEARRPSLPVVAAVWAALAVVLVDGARTLLVLHVAQPGALFAAASSVLAHALRAALAVLVVAAAADHLLKAQARRTRLGLDEQPAGRRAATIVVDDGRADTLVREATLVLFDDDRAIAVVHKDGTSYLWARGRGLAALALREAARIQGKKLRAASGLAAFDTLVLGSEILS